MARLIVPVVVLGVVSTSAEPGGSCESNLEEEEDETSSLLQVGGNSRGISSRSAPRCPLCKGCLDEKACNAGLTVQEYCKQHPNTHGCDVATDDATKDCCRDLQKVECKACQNQVTLEEECMQNTRRWLHKEECFGFYKPYCEDFLMDLEENDKEFEGFPEPSHSVCNAVVPKPYNGDEEVDLDKETCTRIYGKEFNFIPFHDPPSSIEHSLEKCIEFGDDCFGVTCSEVGDSVSCTTRRNSELVTSCDRVHDGMRWRCTASSVKERAKSVFSLRKSDCTVDEDDEEEDEEEDPPKRMKKMMKMMMKK